jgi:hypothetical protein
VIGEGRNHEVRLGSRHVRRSASAFKGLSDAHRITMIPGEKIDQYRRNFARAAASVATARVSVRKIDACVPFASARSVQMIFT